MSARRHSTVALLALLVALAAGPAPVAAHPDPPGPPPVEVKVTVVGIATATDQDDGGFLSTNWDAELALDYTVSRGGVVPSTHAGESASYPGFDYDWDTHQGRLKDTRLSGGYPLLYRHVECSPLDQVSVETKVNEDDGTSSDDLGSGSVTFDPDQLSRSSPQSAVRSGVKTVDTGQAKVRIRVEAVDRPDLAADCSDPRRQPRGKASSISTDSGPAIYDWQFANLMKDRVAGPGYANLVLVFDQCYGGGMLDDLSTLQGTGDVAALAASAFDQKAKVDDRSETDPQSHFSEGLNDAFEQTGPDAVTVHRAASRAEARMESGPYQRSKDVVNPQNVFYGSGKDIKLGKKTDGSAVKSRHAVLFGGNANHPAMWRDLDRAYESLTKRHGFSDDDVHVLFDAGEKSPTKHLPKGQTKVPDYVDGPGTKKALFETVKRLQSEMNDEEQLVIWTMDHGNSEARSKAMEKAVKRPEKTAIAPAGSGTLSVESWFLDDARADPENSPFVSLVVAPGERPGSASTDGNGSTDGGTAKSLPAEPPAWTRNVSVSLNDRELDGEPVAPVRWADADPDVDGYELVFPAPESSLARENAVAVDWRGDREAFEPYVVTMVQLSNGDIAKVPDERADEPPTETPPPEPSLVERLSERTDAVNEALGSAPLPVRRAAAGERVHVTVEREDGNVTTLGVVTAGDGTVEVVRSHVEEPTVVAWTDGETADRIADAEDPMTELVAALEDGRIEYRGTSRLKRFQIGLGRFIGGLF